MERAENAAEIRDRADMGRRSPAPLLEKERGTQVQ